MKKRIETVTLPRWAVMHCWGGKSDYCTLHDSRPELASRCVELGCRVVRLVEADPAERALVRLVLKHLDALSGVGVVGEIREAGLRLRAVARLKGKTP